MKNNVDFRFRFEDIVVFVNRSHIHVLQDTTLFISLFYMVGSVN